MILASDYDGTLTTIEGKVEKKTTDAIHRFRSLHHYFGIISGRSVLNIQRKQKQYNIPTDFIVGNNGAVVLIDGKQVFKHSLTSQKSQVLYDYLKKRCILFAVCDGYYYSFYGKGKWILHRFLQKDGTNIDHMIKANQVVSFIVYGIKFKYRKTFREDVCKEFDVEAYRNGFSLDIMDKGINKANGLAIVKKHYNQELYVIGDGDNDIPMLDLYHGFSVDNASSKVKQHAAKVFKNVQSCIDYLTKR